MLDAAQAKGVKFLLPVDSVVADKFPETKDASDIQTKVVEGDIEDGWMGLDIGPKSVALFSDAIKGAKTVVWNGPMGCFEFAPLAKGTFGVCDAVATVKANGGHRRRRQRERGEEERQGRGDDAHLHRWRRFARIPGGQGPSRRGGAERQVIAYVATERREPFGSRFFLSPPLDAARFFLYT